MVDELSDSTHVRTRNRAVVLAALRDVSSATTLELVQATGLSRPTVQAIVGAECTHDGLIASEQALGRPGRPPMAWRLTPPSTLAVGLDLGPHRVRAVACDLTGRVVARCTREVSDPATVLDLADAAITEVAGGRAGHLGVSVPALVDDAGRVRRAIPLPQLQQLDLPAEFARRHGVPTRADNDVAMALWGEHTFGVAQNVDSAVLVHIGHRTGAAIMVGGEIIRGRNAAAGGLGHVREVGWTDMWPAPGCADVTESLLRAGEGDAAAVGWMQEHVEALARGIAAMVFVVDPDLVVVSGGVSAAGEVLVAPVRDALAGRLLEGMDTPMVVGQFEADDAVTGALARALRALTDDHIGTAGPLPQLH